MAVLLLASVSASFTRSDGFYSRSLGFKGFSPLSCRSKGKHLCLIMRFLISPQVACVWMKRVFFPLRFFSTFYSSYIRVTILWVTRTAQSSDAVENMRTFLSFVRFWADKEVKGLSRLLVAGQERSNRVKQVRYDWQRFNNLLYTFTSITQP